MCVGIKWVKVVSGIQTKQHFSNVEKLSALLELVRCFFSSHESDRLS